MQTRPYSELKSDLFTLLNSPFLQPINKEEKKEDEISILTIEDEAIKESKALRIAEEKALRQKLIATLKLIPVEELLRIKNEKNQNCLQVACENNNLGAIAAIIDRQPKSLAMVDKKQKSLLSIIVKMPTINQQMIFNEISSIKAKKEFLKSCYDYLNATNIHYPRAKNYQRNLRLRQLYFKLNALLGLKELLIAHLEFNAAIPERLIIETITRTVTPNFNKYRPIIDHYGTLQGYKKPWSNFYVTRKGIEKLSLSLLNDLSLHNYGERLKKLRYLEGNDFLPDQSSNQELISAQITLRAFIEEIHKLGEKLQKYPATEASFRLSNFQYERPSKLAGLSIAGVIAGPLDAVVYSEIKEDDFSNDFKVILSVAIISTLIVISILLGSFYKKHSPTQVKSTEWKPLISNIREYLTHLNIEDDNLKTRLNEAIIISNKRSKLLTTIQQRLSRLEAILVELEEQLLIKISPSSLQQNSMFANATRNNNDTVININENAQVNERGIGLQSV